MTESTDASMNSTLLSSQPSMPPEMTEKQQWVQDIIAKDRTAFDEWTEDPTNAQRLNMPHGAARFLAIPSRILELVDDPAKVDIHILRSDEDELLAIVYENTDADITNEQSLKNYLQALNEFLQKRDTRNIPYPKIPDDVDNIHLHLARLGYRDKFNLNDFILNEIYMSGPFPPVLNVDNYEDRERYRNKGVARSFYGRLHSSAHDLGYRFVTGFNNPDNIDFFKRKLGRNSLDQIDRNLRHDFHPAVHAGKYPRHFTVDFLYPEDKAKYVIQDLQV